MLQIKANHDLQCSRISIVYIATCANFLRSYMEVTKTFTLWEKKNLKRAVDFKMHQHHLRTNE